MSAHHLPVLPHADDVTSREDRFRCDRLHAVVTGALCSKRHTASRRVNAHHGEALYPGCALCTNGRALVARLTGAQPQPRPVPVQVEREQPVRSQRLRTGHSDTVAQDAPCAWPGCERRAQNYRTRLDPRLRPFCVRHRTEIQRKAFRLVRDHGVPRREALGRAVAGPVVRPPRTVRRDPCVIPGCAREAAHVRSDTRPQGIGCCDYHRERIAAAAVTAGGDYTLARLRVEALARAGGRRAGVCAAVVYERAGLSGDEGRSRVAELEAQLAERDARVRELEALIARERAA